MNFDHLSSTDFEELCYDLLLDLGYRDLSWRKGTALASSPSDQGRDIEAKYMRDDADGQIFQERWFIECKHWKQGVPPTELASALTWCAAERPDVLLIVVSGFLSNPAKNWIEQYKINNTPSLKIRIWERKDLERLLMERTLLLRKYKLTTEFEFVNILHPLHLEYIRKTPLNTLDYFLKVLDGIEPGKRDRWFYGCFICVIKPRAKEPTSGDQVMGELLLDTVSYHEFKKACNGLSDEVEEHFLVRGIVSEALAEVFRHGDKTARDEFRCTHQSAIEFFKQRLKDGSGNTKALQRCIRMSTKKLETLDEDLLKSYESYQDFCREVIGPLFLEEMKQLPDVMDKLNALTSSCSGYPCSE